MRKMLIGLVLLSVGAAMLFVLFSLKTVDAGAPPDYVCEKTWGGFDSPSGFGVDKKGNVWLAEAKKHLVLIVDPITKNEKELSFSTPRDVCFDSSGYYYVTSLKYLDKMYPEDVFQWKKQVFDIENEPGAPPDNYLLGGSIALDAAGNIYVIGIHKNSGKGLRIQKIAPDGKIVWNEVGTGHQGPLLNATGIAADIGNFNSYCYVADTLHNGDTCIWVFSLVSSAITHKLLIKPGWLTNNKGIATGLNGNIFMGDGKGRIAEIHRSLIEPNQYVNINYITWHQLDRTFKEVTDLAIYGLSDNMIIYVLDAKAINEKTQKLSPKLYKFIHKSKVTTPTSPTVKFDLDSVKEVSPKPTLKIIPPTTTTTIIRELYKKNK